ncbi:MAG: CvpA family protein [Phycisphaerales bacterium]|jgi:hypothetical protein
MLISIISIAVVLVTGYIWLTRGFYSALLNFICTVIAGAIAFGVWEPVSLAILDFGGTNTFLDSSAWALGLALPFGISLALLRLVIDALLRANVGTNDTANYVGGAVLGLLSGIIVSGIMTISLSYLRVDFLNNRSFTYGPGGNITRSGGLWVPFDKFVVKAYGFLSENSFASDEPLARLNPDAYENGNAMRMTAFDSAGRNTAHPDDFAVTGRFIVGDPSGKGDFNSLLGDAWRPGTQPVTDPSGNPYPPNSHIEGVIVNFKAGSKERDGKTAVGAAQVRLLLENPTTDEHLTVFPIAVSSQSEPALPAIARWRYDAKDVFIASVGGGSDAPFAFEFPCPPGFQPTAIYVKGIRAPLDAGKPVAPDKQFASAQSRDEAIATGFGLDPNGRITGAQGEVQEDGPINTRAQGGGSQIPGVQVGPGLYPSFVQMLQKGSSSAGDFELGEGNAIQRGHVKIGIPELPTAGLEKPLQIKKLETTSDANIVWLDVSGPSRNSLLGKSIDIAEQILPPLLVDTLGTSYQPVGFIYLDESTFEMSYDPGKPIQAMSELPSLSRSRPKQKMALIFRVSTGREVKYFKRGSKVISEWEPPFLVGPPGR